MNFKKLGLLFALAFLCGMASAQSTTVSVTVVDTGGVVWSNGTISYTFSPIAGFSGKYQWQGADLPANYLVATTVNLDNSGFATFPLPSNSAITPAGTGWSYKICPNATSPCLTTVIPATGATQDISSIVTPQLNPIRINPTLLPRAYNDTEIQITVGYGAEYINSTTGIPRYYNGSWHDFGTGGGGGSSPFGIIDAFLAQTGSSCNGIVNGFTTIAGGGGTVWAGPSYDGCTEQIGNLGQTAPNVLMGPNASYTDLRNGATNTIHSNVGSSALFGGQDWLEEASNCYTTQSIGWTHNPDGTATTYFGSNHCRDIINTQYEPGYYFGFSGTPVVTDPFGTTTLNIQDGIYAAGISTGVSIQHAYYSNGDNIGIQNLLTGKCAWLFPADEGCKGERAGVGDTFPMSGNITSTTTSGTVLNYTATAAGESVGIGHPAIDVQSVVLGTVSASTVLGNGLTQATWTGSSLPVSKLSTLQANILTPLVTTQGNHLACFPETFNVTLASSAFAVDDLIKFVDVQFQETARVTAVGTPSGSTQSITACLLFPHVGGSTVAANGMVGTYLDFPDYTFGGHTYLQEIYYSIDAHTFVFGFQAPAQLSSIPINASAGYFLGGQIIGVTPPATRGGTISQITLWPNNAAWVPGTDVVNVPNNISELMTGKSLSTESSNPFAFILGHDETLDGQAWAGVRINAWTRVINNEPFANYFAGSQAPVLFSASGIFSNGFVMDTPQSIGTGFHGCGATVFCVDGPPSGVSESTFNWFCKGNTGACMQWQTNNHFAVIGAGGFDFQGVPVSIAFSGIALDIQGALRLKNFTSGQQPDLIFCDDAACTNTAQIGFALPPSDGAHPFLGVGCNHSGTSPTSCTGAFAVGSPFTVSGSAITPTADITLSTPTSDNWFIGDLDSSYTGWAGALTFSNGTKGYIPFGVRVQNSTTAQFILGPGTLLCWNSTSLTTGAPASCISQTGAGDFTFGDSSGAANGSIHCASGCGGGGGSGTVTTFGAPSGSWPTWLVPTVTNPTTTPSLTVAASAIPHSAIASTAVTPGSYTLASITVQADGTITAASSGSSGVANVVVAMPTTSLTSGSCTSPASVSMSGLTTSMAFSTSFVGDPGSAAGWGTSGGLELIAWPTANTFNSYICNRSASTIVPGAISLNIGAR